MYKQSIQNIEVAILSLDGVILDLNRMRFNYYNRLCKDHHITLDKLEFHHQLSNMYDMYTKLPLHNIYESGVLNAKIERELFQYLSYSGVTVKEGVYELIEYFHQKNIKVAVISTHHTKNAVEYLKLAKLYNKVHFIVGSDSKCLPLPSNQMLEAIRNHFQVETHHVLVISSFLALQKAANASKMNIIHCDDFVEITSEDKQTCYKCVKDAFDVLNTLLFDKYAEETMYSSILGMNHSMSHYELDETYKNLNEKYADDKDLLDIVDQTYQYHISQLNEHHIKDASILKSTYKKFVFEDEEDKETLQTSNEVVDNISFEDETIKEQDNSINEAPSFSHVKQLNKEEEDELSALLKQIQKKDHDTNSNKDDIKDFQLNLNDEDIESEENTNKEDNLFISIIFEFISATLTSLTLLFLGIVISVLLMHQWGKGGFISIIEKLYTLYSAIVTTCFSFIFDSLHNIFSFIPTYMQYVNENTVLSNDGVHFVNMFIFNTIVIFMIRLIIILKGGLKNDRKD